MEAEGAAAGDEPEEVGYGETIVHGRLLTLLVSDIGTDLPEEALIWAL
jgi:hypothetical protein